MPIRAALTLAVSMSAVAAAASSGPGQVPAAAARVSSSAEAYPIAVQLMTVVDHPATLAGHAVQLPPVRVRRLIAPGLVVVGPPHGRGNYRSFGPSRWDKILVLLPPSTAVGRDDQIVLVGTLRTVRGARLAGQLSGQLDGLREKVRKRLDNATLLVAETVQTADGVDLARR